MNFCGERGQRVSDGYSSSARWKWRVNQYGEFMRLISFLKYKRDLQKSDKQDWKWHRKSNARKSGHLLFSLVFDVGVRSTQFFWIFKGTFVDKMQVASHFVDFKKRALKATSSHICRVVNHKSNHRVQIEDLFCGWWFSILCWSCESHTCCYVFLPKGKLGTTVPFPTIAIVDSIPFSGKNKSSFERFSSVSQNSQF